MTMLRDEWNQIEIMDSIDELDHEIGLLGELSWETSQLIAQAKHRKTELRRAALGGRLRGILGGKR